METSTIHISTKPQILLGYFDLLIHSMLKAEKALGTNPMMLQALFQTGMLQEQHPLLIEQLEQHGTPEAQAFLRGEEMSQESARQAMMEFARTVVAIHDMSSSLSLLRQEIARLNNQPAEPLHTTAEFGAEMMAQELGMD
jgi:hypothetical protein